MPRYSSGQSGTGAAAHCLSIVITVHEVFCHRKVINFYFARPYHSWERGANENINGLVRQYFPKGTDFSEVTEQQVETVEDLINSRPRKRLEYYTPIEFINTLKKHRRELRL